jgi:WD40 repeat protein
MLTSLCPLAQVWHLAFSPGSGTRLATAGKDGTACLWRLQGSAQGVSAVLQHSLEGHTGPVTCLAWAPHGSLLLTCSSDRTARVWDTATGDCLHILARHSDTVTSGAWESATCVYTASIDKKIIAWDLPASGGEPRERECFKVPRVNDMAFSADGTLLAAVCAEKRVRLWWPATGREAWLTESQPVTSLCVSAQGRFILLHMQSQELHLWDLSSGQQHSLGAIQRGSGALTTAMPTAPTAKFRPGNAQNAGRYIVRATLGGVDEHFVASGSEDSQVYLWNRDKGDLLAVLPGHSSVVNAVQWSAQPGLLASASDDRTVRLWASEGLLARLRQGEPLFEEQ